MDGEEISDTGAGGIMKARAVHEVLIWLLVINLGIAFGAGIYEARIVVPGFADLPPHAWPNTGVQFWVYVTTVPFTLLTLANAYLAWKSQGPRRKWHLAAVGILVVERLATFAYFIPTMVGLMGAEGLSQGEIAAALSEWQFYNHGRHLLTLSGWLAALKVLSFSRSADPE